MSEFDERVAALRNVVTPRHKPCGLRKRDCTPEQWAAHLAWQRQYLDRPGRRELHEVYRNRSIARKSAIR